jgi:hypothetical protein
LIKGFDGEINLCEIKKDIKERVDVSEKNAEIVKEINEIFLQARTKPEIK